METETLVGEIAKRYERLLTWLFEVQGGHPVDYDVNLVTTNCKCSFADAESLLKLATSDDEKTVEPYNAYELPPQNSMVHLRLTVKGEMLARKIKDDDEAEKRAAEEESKRGKIGFSKR